MRESFYEMLKEEVMAYFEPTDDLHGWSHTQRVLNMANRITEDLKVDSDVVRMAAMLHDIANPLEMRGDCKCHAEKRAEMAREILGKTSLNPHLIGQVCYAIKVHRVSKRLGADTIEAKVLQDADRLDALGAIIVARCFDWSSQKKRPYYDPDAPVRDFYDGSPSASTIHHMQEKILRLTPDKFHTPVAKEIAKGRYEFVSQFVDRFIKEWKGEL